MPYQAGSSAQRIRIGLTALAASSSSCFWARSSAVRAATTSPMRRSKPRPMSRASRSPSLELHPAHHERRTTAAKKNDPRAPARDPRCCLDPRSRGARFPVRAPPPGAPPPAPEKRPPLLLLTSLPLVFSEDFSLEGGGSDALKALETRYRVVPISVTDGADLAKGRLLLMAHPLAQTAENLVVLDLGSARRARPAPRRSNARMAEQAPSGRSAAPSADVRGHRLACALGAKARRA